MQPLTLLCAICIPCTALADGPQDNKPEAVRPIPPPGIKVDETLRKALLSEADKLDAELNALVARSKDNGRTAGFAPDILIFSKAVRYALTLNAIYNERELRTARELLAMGRQRFDELAAGKPLWPAQTGLIVRGYRSSIDDSIQPYGLVIPAGYRFDPAVKTRLDIWLHGRGETLTELAFLDQRRKQPGEFTPAGAIVLHPYGRYCNAFRFAGETDVFEALADVKKRYRIDDNRIVMRGFSMGGAGCWQFATHHSGLWAAAAPGAGFSETADFLQVFQREKIQPTWYEQKLWNLYDSTTYARNVFNVPTVAYSGEIDKQKQAADFMAAALAKEGMSLTHIIGPKTAHKYEPKAKEEVNRRVDLLAELGRTCSRSQIVTYTLRYNRVRWLSIDGMERHWEPAEAAASLSEDGLISISSIKNVSAFSIDLEPGMIRENWVDSKIRVIIHDGSVEDTVKKAPDEFKVTQRQESDRSLRLHFAKQGKDWKVVPSVPSGIVKRHGLQGPIDDAFMGPFAFVRPTGKPISEVTGKFVERELSHAIAQWKLQFRGDPIVIDDVKVTDNDLKNRNLVLWGDPQSNAVFAKVAKSLPLSWTADAVKIGGASAGPTSVPIMIYPNPLNPDRYVVLNSGFTFREYDLLSNARQTPKLPDWAIVDASTPMTSRSPGKVVDAGFFDEEWKWQAKK